MNLRQFLIPTADARDLLSIGLLQNRLNEIGGGTPVELSGMHKSRRVSW
tara:strand:- start:254 stop:400 length:147 start_codon:yes stop_codon:yes gene_type:complete